MACPGPLYIAAATVAVLITQGTAKIQCYDNTAANCRGNKTNVDTHQECCHGKGYWFQNTSGDCEQCSEFQCYDNTAPNCGGSMVNELSTHQQCCHGKGYWFRNLTSGDCEQCSGSAEYLCYDNAAANCGGNVISGVSTRQDCCLGNGYWFQNLELGECEHCNATIPTVKPTLTPVQVKYAVSCNTLMVVPLNVGDSTRMELGLGESEYVSLCYEVHGEADENFNLVSDVCVSVNAHYMRVRSDVDINIIDTIGVRTVGNDDQCRNIQVDLDGCRASVDGVEITMPYRVAGISVRKYTNRVRIAVPNCEDHDLVMWVFCQNGTFSYNDTSTFQSPMIRFVIASGFNLPEISHGILGQFCNIPTDVVRYNMSIYGTVRSDTYKITVNYPGQTRQFVGFLYPLTCEFDERQCLYVGNGQGGPIDEVDDPNDPVLQGEYTDYIMDDIFSTDFAFAHFETSRCPTLIPPPTLPPDTPA